MGFLCYFYLCRMQSLKLCNFLVPNKLASLLSRIFWRDESCEGRIVWEQFAFFRLPLVSHNLRIRNSCFSQLKLGVRGQDKKQLRPPQFPLLPLILGNEHGIQGNHLFSTSNKRYEKHLGDVHILRNTNLGSQETPHKSSKRKTFFTLFKLFKYELLKQQHVCLYTVRADGLLSKILDWS